MDLLFKSVMADWLATACHSLFIFCQQLKVFRQNFSQTRNSLANYSQIRVFGECLARALHFQFINFNSISSSGIWIELQFRFWNWIDPTLHAMAWHWTGNKSLPKPMVTRICCYMVSPIDLARNGSSGFANEILGCAKCHFWWKSPWKWKN